MAVQRASRFVVVGADGDPCPRCGLPTEIREHTEITAKHLRQPYYYSRWFKCLNERCQTTLIMPSRYIVWIDPDAETPEQRADRQRIEAQLTAPPGWL